MCSEIIYAIFTTVLDHSYLSAVTNFHLSLNSNKLKHKKNMKVSEAMASRTMINVKLNIPVGTQLLLSL